MRGLVTLGVVVLALSSVGVVSANEAPLAEAGLDQDAGVNTTVYLDAGGSLDPDGEIDRHEWSIETPDGNATAPNCTTCPQTWFVPNQTGLYNVTIRVVDDDGAAMEDTLFIVVAGASLPSSSSSPPASSPSSPSSPSSSYTDPPSSSDPGGGGSGVAVPGSGGSPGLTSQTARIVETENGELYLSGGLDQDVYEIPVGGNYMSVSGDRFQQAQTGPGTAPLTEFRDEMRATGYTLGDAREAVDSDTCKTTRGTGCAARVGRGTYDEDAGAINLDDVSSDNDEPNVNDDDDLDHGDVEDEDNYSPGSASPDSGTSRLDMTSLSDSTSQAEQVTETAATAVDTVSRAVDSLPGTGTIVSPIVDTVTSFID